MVVAGLLLTVNIGCGGATIRVVVPSPVMRTSLESVRLSNTCDVMLNVPDSRLTTRGKPRAASVRDHARAASRVQLAPAAQLRCTAHGKPGGGGEGGGEVGGGGDGSGDGGGGGGGGGGGDGGGAHVTKRKLELPGGEANW